MKLIVTMTTLILSILWVPIAYSGSQVITLSIDDNALQPPALTIPHYDEVNGKSEYFLYEFELDDEGKVINITETNDNYHYDVINQVEAYFEENQYPQYIRKSGSLTFQYKPSENLQVINALHALELLDDIDDNLSQRRKILEEGLEIEPDNVALKFELADVLSDEGNLEESIALFREVVAAVPHNSHSLYSLAYRLYLNENFDEAKLHLKKSLSLGETWEAHWLLFDIAGKEEKELEALSHINRALEATSTEDAYLYAQRGWYLFSINSKLLALKDFDRALEKEPTNSSALSGIGRTYVDLERYDEAKKHAEKALRLNPNDTYDLEIMADIYEAGDEPEKAVEYYERIIEIDEQANSMLNNFGYLYAKLGRYDEAIATYLRAQNLGLDSEFVSNNLGVAYYWQGDCQKSSQAFLEVETKFYQDSTSPVGNHYLAECLIKDGNINEAFERLERALDADSNYVDSLYENRTGSSNFLMETLQKVQEENQQLGSLQRIRLKQYLRQLKKEQGS